MLLVNWFSKLRNLGEQRRSRRRTRRASRRSIARYDWAAVECLEARTLLSNVAVAVTGGVISLTGDSGNHTVHAAVVNLPSGNTTVPNLEFTGTGNTTFSFGNTTNVTTLDIPLSQIGAINGLTISMQAGDDAVTFDATNLGTISGAVSVQLGSGTNSFVFNDATVTGKMSVRGGTGNDTIQMTNDNLATLGIDTGDGTDAVTLTSLTIAGTDETPADTGLQGFVDNLVTSVEGFLSDLLGDLQSRLPDQFGGALSGLGQQLQSHFGGNSARTNSATALNIQMGNGDDSVDLESVTGLAGTGSTADSGAGQFGQFSWLFSNNSWQFGNQWKINLGGGNDTVTVNGAQLAQSLAIGAGDGNDTVNLTGSTIGGTTQVNLGSGQDNINVQSSTFTGRTSLSTGSGDSSTISIDDSTFNARTKIAMGGSNANLNIETQGTPGPGTTFDAPLTVKFFGPSATATFGSSSPDDTLTFNSRVFVFGGIPAATVAIDPSVTIDDSKLFLFNANRT